MHCCRFRLGLRVKERVNLDNIFPGPLLFPLFPDLSLLFQRSCQHYFRPMPRSSLPPLVTSLSQSPDPSFRGLKFLGDGATAGSPRWLEASLPIGEVKGLVVTRPTSLKAGESSDLRRCTLARTTSLADMGDAAVVLMRRDGLERAYA